LCDDAHAQGDLVVVIAATQADDMASAVRLKLEFGFDVCPALPPLQ
jgi:hypothetical protein